MVANRMDETEARFFDDFQRRTIEAAMARIIPTDHEPGARDAGAIDFLDRYLSGINFVYAKPDGNGFERLEGERAREEEQSIAGFAPPEPALQQIAAEIDLDFFPLLVLHTRQGFLADPIYGGNRGRVGWDVIGFPGPTSLVEAHAGCYSTLPYFYAAETSTATGDRGSR